MGPSRKRSRTTAPPNESSTANNKPRSAEDELKNIAVQIPLPETPSNASSANPLEHPPTSEKATKGEHLEKLKPRASWYGTWPRKSVASISLAKETISADKPAATLPKPLRSEQKNARAVLSRPPSMTLGKSKETTDLTVAGATETGASSTKSKDSSVQPVDNVPSLSKEAITTLDGNKDTSEVEPVERPGKSDLKKITEEEEPERPVTSSGWLGSWLARPIVQPSTAVESVKPPSIVEQPPALPDEHKKDMQDSKPVTAQSIPAIEVPPPTTIASTPQATSWFGSWSRIEPVLAAESQDQAQVPIVATASVENTVMEDELHAPTAKSAPGSSWAFWTSEAKKADEPVIRPADTEGELAVTGESSENRPEPAKTVVTKTSTTSKGKKKEKQKVEADVIPPAVTQVETASIKSTSSKTATASKQVPPNLLIPSVRNTYRLLENPSILQQITRLLLHGKEAPSKHLFLTKDKPKIKNALAIGIHGLFPAPLLRTVIGQPTGTSIKFANHAAEAIRRWADGNGSKDCEIEKVALEGEGKIDDRVDNLWKLLLNWIEHVRKADFILIGCHSQGVPVAVMLVAKLIEFGVVSIAKIGICSMAGVSLGPFADYKSRLFSGSAGELFDFANPESAVSKRYEESLRVALKYGAKITYCGSIDDQLVSLESSIFSTVSHPHIFRVVFVDGRIHAPDFLAHLVGFALKLRNLGVSDHGLIRELSAPLAGSLYTGEGHSRLYDEGKVYDFAAEFALETTSANEIPLQVTKYEIPSNANPYVLPWIMRGLLEEDFVKTELDAETTELLKQFDDWRPTTKVLKDVKYRLEAVKSKL